jgi:hypothetical protein
MEAIAAVGQELGLDDSERPEIDHDTKDTPGMAEITKTILDKIAGCAVFVADLTPIGKTDGGKALPNPNVLIELGWAHHRPGPDRLIAVLNTASGWKPDDLPFDVRHRRVLPYELADTADAKTRKEAKTALVKALTSALRVNLGKHLEAKAAATDVRGVAPQSADRSIWSTASTQFEHSDAFAAGSKKSIVLPKGPRGYIRIIPAGWNNGPPSVHAISQQGENTLWPPAEGLNSGDCGACEEGFVRYWMTGKSEDGKTEAENVVMYFDETGEFWMLHGTAIGGDSDARSLYVQSLMRGWAHAMKTALAAFESFGGFPVVRIEAGLVGMKDVYWLGPWRVNSPRARKDSCVTERKQRDWSDEERLKFLVDAYNAVLNIYGLPRASSDDVIRLIG